MTSSIEVDLDAGVSIAGEGPLNVAASVFVPEKPRPIVLVCLAGGNMNRRYFHLQPDDGAPVEPPFSFAQAMTAQGFVVVTLDHLGLGDSSRPEDGYALTPELLTQANSNATRQVLEGLRQGTLDSQIPAIPELRSVGIGHSMGALMTILQQHASCQHVAIAVLGFATRGLPAFVPENVRWMTRAEQRARLVELARAMFHQPYPRIQSTRGGGRIYGSDNADPRGIAALKAATDCLLPVPGYLSMLPGNVAPEAAQISVPVFIGVGENDMTGPPDDIPKAFTTSSKVTLEVFPETGHSHFLFPSRAVLFEKLAAWVQANA